MSANWGTTIELSLFGESHGKAIGVVIGNLPAGITIDMDEIYRHMQRRAPGQNRFSTIRKETDDFQIMSGLLDGVTTGAPLCAMIKNQDHHSNDYSQLKECMRPGHSDYPAYIKYHGFNDVRGGGHFSGRLTAPLVFAGSIARQILAQKGIKIGAHILSVQDVKEEHFSQVSDELLDVLSKKSFPTLDKNKAVLMQERIDQARLNQDSVGGSIECVITGIPAGLGNPFFDSMESHLSSLLFSIPAVKSISFGEDDDITLLLGSEANDAYYYEQGQVKTKTNHNGGITGGISNGMPILFRVGIKPTPSISKSQETINVKTHENTEISIRGRHDPCIVPRAVVVVESMAALAILDMMNQL